MNRHDEEHQARAALTYAAGPGDTQLPALVNVIGAPATLRLLTHGPEDAAAREAARHLQIPPAGMVARWRSRLAGLPHQETVPAGTRLVCPGDSEWPVQLTGPGDQAPIALWVRGDGNLRESCQKSVAVTGARACTAYGSYVAAELAAGLAERRVTVISGGGYGTDAAAHRASLSADGQTVAVLASGTCRAYPAGHADLFQAITTAGVLVSEAPPLMNATRLRFLARNRLIAALSDATVVVEAAQRSGSLSTARRARELGKPLMAVPGPVTSALSAGTNALIRDGHAVLVTGADDITARLAAGS